MNQNRDNPSIFKAMFEQATVGIVVVDERGLIQKNNSLVEQLFGYEKGELLQQSIEILVPDSAKRVHANFRKNYYKKPMPRLMGQGREVIGKKKDGTTFPVETSLNHLDFGEEKLTIAFLNDISTRRKTLSALQKSEAKLAEYSQQLEQKVKERTLQLEASQTKLLLANKLAKIAYLEILNDAPTAMYYSDELLHILEIDTPPVHFDFSHFIQYIHPEDNAAATQLSNKSICDLQGLNIDYRIITAKGNEKYLHSEFQCIQQNNSNVVRLFAIIQDVTELKNAETKLANALQKEKELGVLKSQFVSMASHEFRTPLSSILSSTSLIEMYLQKGLYDKQAKHLSRIKTSVNNLTAILNDFLSFEKLQSGKIMFSPQKINAMAFIEEVLEEISVTKKEGQSIVHQHLAKQEILIDPHLVKNVLLNLLSNAIKYSDEGSKIELFTKASEKELIIKVTDRGVGIPEEDQKHMFSQFFRASNVSHIKGNGLGLTIVKRYLELMNGTISFVSQPNVGTTFTVTIPQ